MIANTLRYKRKLSDILDEKYERYLDAKAKREKRKLVKAAIRHKRVIRLARNSFEDLESMLKD